MEPVGLAVRDEAADGAADSPTIVLVHGAFHSASSWDRVLAELVPLGLRARAIDLPGRGTRATQAGGLRANVAALHEEIEAAAGPVVLCGHSMGGLVITAGGDHPSVQHLVYVAALMPAPGERQSEFQVEVAQQGSRVVSGMIAEPTQLRFDPAVAVEAFYHDCTEADAAWAVEQLVPEPLDWALTGDPAVLDENDRCAFAAWEKVTSTYVVCTDDQAFPVGLQRRLAMRASTAVDLAAGHSPFITMPAAVAELLHNVARTA